MSLSQQLLVAIRDSVRPVSTPDLVAAYGPDRPHGREQVWGYLLRLEYRGLVRRDVRPGTDPNGHERRIAYWSKT